jgi:hypothetical protein
VLFGHTKLNLPLRDHPYEGIGGAVKSKLVRIFER